MPGHWYSPSSNTRASTGTLRIELNGTQEFINRVNRMAEKHLPQRVHAATSAGAKQIEKTAKGNAARLFTKYGTGETQRRIRVFLDKGGQRGSLAFIGVVGEGFSDRFSVGSWDRKPIGFFQEYGFHAGKRFIPARPFMRPALDDHREGIRQDIRRQIETAVREV